MIRDPYPKSLFPLLAGDYDGPPTPGEQGLFCSEIGEVSITTTVVVAFQGRIREISTEPAEKCFAYCYRLVSSYRRRCPSVFNAPSCIGERPAPPDFSMTVTST